MGMQPRGWPQAKRMISSGGSRERSAPCSIAQTRRHGQPLSTFHFARSLSLSRGGGDLPLSIRWFRLRARRFDRVLSERLHLSAPSGSFSEQSPAFILSCLQSPHSMEPEFAAHLVDGPPRKMRELSCAHCVPLFCGRVDNRAAVSRGVVARLAGPLGARVALLDTGQSV